MVLFLCTGQPVLRQVMGPANKTTLLVLSERYLFCDRVARRLTGWIPACIDHAGADEDVPEGTDQPSDFVVPHPLNIGRLIYAMVRANGQLLIVGEIYHEQPEGMRIVNDIKAGRKWGVSLCTSLRVTPDWTSVTYKEITHLGITPNPEYGDENTWIHLAAVTPDVFYRKLVKKYINREPGMYVPLAMLEQLSHMLGPNIIIRPEEHQRMISLSVGASRDLASNPTSHLSHAPSDAPSTFHHSAAPPLSAWFSLEETKSIKDPWFSPFSLTMSAPSDPMSGVTPTNPTTPAPAAASTSSPNPPVATSPPLSSSSPSPSPSPPTTQVDSNAFSALALDAKGFLKNTVDPLTGQANIGLNTVSQAKNYVSKISDYLNKAGVSSNVDQWPEGAVDLLSSLGSIEKVAKTENQQFAAKFYEDDPVLAKQLQQALEKPLLPENLPPAAVVFATKKKWMANQREFDSIIASKNAEVDQAKKLSASHETALAKLKSEMETKMNEFQAKLSQQQPSSSTIADSLAKRQNTGLTPAELASAKGQNLPDAMGGVPVAPVGASQGTRSNNGVTFDEEALRNSFGKDARIYQSGWLGNFARQPTPRDEHLTSLFLTGAMNSSSLGAKINNL